jgi:membrane associated rhomboid family serine protease
MFPIRDDNPAFLRPITTLALIAANAATWTLIQGLGASGPLAHSICELGLIPGELLGRLPPGTGFPLTSTQVCIVGVGRAWFQPLTSMFLHAGWLHLIGNMWFLWIFGNNVEDAMGHARFLVFYLLGGLAAAALQVVLSPDSAVPMVGASGAIGGVMGAYIVLYPRVRVHMLVLLGFYVTTLAVPAYLMLGYWFLLQLLGGAVGLGAATQGGTAFWAHVGGFATGALLIRIFRNPALLARHPGHGLGAAPDGPFPRRPRPGDGWDDLR